MRNYKSKSLVINYFIDPLLAGLHGFGLFFSVILIVKLFSYLFSSQYHFYVFILDMFISFVGFSFAFTVRIMHNFNNN